MNKTRILFLLALTGLITSLMIHHRSATRLADFERTLQRQNVELDGERAKQRLLLEEVATATNHVAIDHSAELTKLQAQVAALQRQTNELAQALKRRFASDEPNPSGTSNAESFAPIDQAALDKKAWEAAHITTAMWDYAEEHQGQFPSSIDQVAPNLAKRKWHLSGANHFEIVFQGLRNQVDGIPEQTVAAIRGIETWLGPDGKPVRVYGVFPYGAVVVEAENVRSWEAEHLFLAANPAINR